MTLRLLRHVVFWLAGLIAVGVSACYGFMLYANRDQVGGFYVLDAELRDPTYLDRLDQSPGKSDIDREEFGFNVHRLKIGRGLVLAHRAFSGGSTAIDDESYMKLTVWIPAGTLPTGKQKLHTSGQALIVYSSGGSAWPRNDCSGYVNGRIDIVPQGDSLKVKVEGEFQPKGNSTVWDHCKPRSVVLEFRAAPERFDRLTPWQGGIGSGHPYDDTYPGEVKAATRDSNNASTTH